jgi:hypothetical protein
MICSLFEKQRDQIIFLADTEKYPTNQLESKLRLIAKQQFSEEINPNEEPAKLREELRFAYSRLLNMISQLAIRKIAEEYQKKAERYSSLISKVILSFTLRTE